MRAILVPCFQDEHGGTAYVLKRAKATLDVVDSAMLLIVPLPEAGKLTVFAFNRRGQLHSWCTDLNAAGRYGAID